MCQLADGQRVGHDRLKRVGSGYSPKVGAVIGAYFLAYGR